MRSNPLRSRFLTGAALALTSLSFLGTLSARVGSDPAPAPAPAENKYIGADKCKSCHNSPDTGDQYSAWKGMKHAKAFETLASEEAKKLAAEKGIADPQTADACLECHVTAFGVPETEIKKGFDRAAGVQCESCHGPGEQHMKARFAAASNGETVPAQLPPDEIVAKPTQAKCLECHNDRSPSFKPFCFHLRNAELRHLNPKKVRAEGELLDCGCATCACAKGCPDDGCGVSAGGKKEGK
jgi:hypothetical protein